MVAVVFAFASMTLGCEEERDVPAPTAAVPGIDQDDDAKGPFVDEDVACETFRDAVLERKDDLGCKEVTVAECPDLVRPAGSLACTRFTKKSLDDCTSRIEGYNECGDFGLSRCLLVSAVNETTGGCVPPGQSDGGDAEDGGPSTSEDDAGPTSEPGDSGSEPMTPADASSDVDAAVNPDAAPPTQLDGAAPESDAAVTTDAATDAAVVSPVLDAAAPDAGPAPEPVVDASTADASTVDAGPDAAL